MLGGGVRASGRRWIMDGGVVCAAWRRSGGLLAMEIVCVEREEVLSFYRPELGLRRLEAVPRMRRHRSVAEERRAAETHRRAGGAVFQILNLRLPSGKRPIRILN